MPTTTSTSPAASRFTTDRLLLGAQEAGQDLDPDGVVREPLPEGLAVLVGEQRGGDEHRDLLAVLHRLERGTDRDLGLAEADVAAHQPVHGDGLLHVVLDVLDGAQLVGGLLERERLLDLVLPRRVGAERVARAGQPAPVEDDELLGDLAGRGPDPGLGALEVGAAHPVQRRGLTAGVAADDADLVGRDVELVAALVLEEEVVLGDAADGPLHHPAVAGHAVGVVHDVVAGLERVVEVRAAAGAAGARWTRRRPVRSASAMSARRGPGRTMPRSRGAAVTPITPGATVSGLVSTPSSART